MTTLKVGIASYEEMKARTMAVGRGERRISAATVRMTSMTTFRSSRAAACGAGVFTQVEIVRCANDTNRAMACQSRRPGNFY